MKELELPTKDLKTGVKVVGSAASGTFEAIRPYLRRTLEKKVANLRKRFSK